MSVETWTREEWAAIQEAAAAFAEQWVRATQSVTDRPKLRYQGECPDEIMARHGVTFDGDREQYLRVERMVRPLGIQMSEATKLPRGVEPTMEAA